MSKKRDEYYELYRIDWTDAASNGGWEDLKETKIKHYKVHSIGWLVHNDADYYVLAQSITSHHTSNDRIQIPKAWVNKVTKITKNRIVYER